MPSNTPNYNIKDTVDIANGDHNKGKGNRYCPGGKGVNCPLLRGVPCPFKVCTG